MAVEAVGVEDVAGHLAGERGTLLGHHGLDQRMAGLVHDRAAAEPRDLVEQRLAGLDVGDDRLARMAGQDLGRQDLQQLIAEQDPALAIDHADPVAIAIEGDAELGAVRADRLDQILEVLGHGGIGMVVREAAVDLGEQQMMLARQRRGQRLERLAGGAVAGVPDHLEGAPALEVLAQAPDIGVEHRAGRARAGAAREGAAGGDPAQLLDALAVERLLAPHHLEAVVIGRVVRAGDLDAAVGVQLMHREVQHRRRAAADLQHHGAGIDQAAADRVGQLGRAQAAVIADADPALRGRQGGGVGAAKGVGIGREQGLADDAAHVVFAQDGRVETVRGAGRRGWRRVGHAAASASLGSRPSTLPRPMLV